MGKPAVLLRHKLIALVAVGLLSCGILPMLALADDSVAASFVLADSEGSGEAATPNPAASGNGVEGTILASSLAPNGTSIVSVDVALDSAEPVIGSFTVDGLTYALNDGGVTLISVAGPLAGPEDDGFAEGEFAKISIPASVAYSGVAYPVTAIGPYAFYLSGATSADLPDSILSVDGRAFRSSDVGRVEVDPANPNLTSFDGALYSADQSRLLLIPEGRKGSVLLSCETEVVEPSLFSHCSLVEAISVEEGGAAFSSWNGCLYSSDGTTFLRVPAGAIDITIKDGCTTIAAGAMEGCAKLERINAPASVISISPDLFETVPTISLPAQMAVQDGTNPGVASGLPDQGNASADLASQLTAMVALSSADDDLPEVDLAAVAVSLPAGADTTPWRGIGFAVPIGASDVFAESGAVNISNSEALTDPAPLVSGLQEGAIAAGQGYGDGDLDEGMDITKDRRYWVWANGGALTYSENCKWSGDYGWSFTEFDISSDKKARFEVTSSSLDIRLTDGVQRTIVSDLAGNAVVGWSYSADAGATITENTPGYVYYDNTPGVRQMWALWRDSTISFDANGGTGGPSGTVKAVAGSAMPRITSAPTRAGYLFDGYDMYQRSTYSSDTYKFYESNGASYANWRGGAINQTLYARWAPNTYTITLSTNGGSVGNSAWTTVTAGSKYAKDYTIESAATTLPTPIRTGYTFSGWTGSNGTTAQTSVTVSKGTTGNLSYTASWVSNVYEIILDDSGGSGGVGSIFEKFSDGWYADKAATQAIESVSIPKREGYAFEGYYYMAPDGSQTLRISSTGEIISGSGAFTGSVTLVAEWSLEVGLAVYANGGYLMYSAACTWEGDAHWGIGKVISYTIYEDGSLETVDTTHTVRLIRSNNASWKLRGWSMAPDGPLLSTGEYETSEDLRLYAQWESSGTIAAYANGGTVGYSDITWSEQEHWGIRLVSMCRIGEDGSLTAIGTDGVERCINSKEDRRLLGWSRTPDGCILEAGDYNIAQNQSFYAIWAGPVLVNLYPNSGALRYSATCHWDDGPDTVPYWSFPNTAKYVIDQDGSITTHSDQERRTAADPDRTNRVLLGWARTPTGPRIPSGTYGGSGTVDLYAFWQTSTVSFDPNGGSGGQSDSVPVTIGEAMPAISKDKPVREGYNFKGWFDGPDYKDARQYYSAECESARRWDIGCDVTLYAGWEPIAYTVSLEDEGETLGSFNLKYGEDLELPKPEHQGWIFSGWEDAETGIVHQPGAVRNLRSEDGAHVVLQAKKVAAVAADVPIEVTARVDLLGLEEQVEASGYIESRSGAALEVAEVAFEPLAGAAALFGSRTADVLLEALAEGSTAADLRFALDAAATEADPSRLAAFALPDGYGTRVPIGYRFVIPDDVLASIDPARFSEVTTPVGQVVYTVALA